MAVRILELLNCDCINDVRTDGFSAFHHAIRSGNTRLVEYIVEKVSDIVNRQFYAKRTALLESILASNDTMVRLILKLGGDWTIDASNGMNALHAACSVGKVGTIQILVGDCKAGVDRKSVLTGYTPLHTAASCGKLRTCQFLISLGADPTIKEKNGSFPFGVAKTVEVEDYLYGEYEKKMVLKGEKKK